MDSAAPPTAEEIEAFVKQTFSRDGIAVVATGRNCVDVTVPSTFTNHTFFCRKLEDAFGAVVHRTPHTANSYTVTLTEPLTAGRPEAPESNGTLAGTAAGGSTRTVVAVVLSTLVITLAVIGIVMFAKTRLPVDTPPDDL